jgi:hypothetical protein
MCRIVHVEMGVRGGMGCPPKTSDRQKAMVSNYLQAILEHSRRWIFSPLLRCTVDEVAVGVAVVVKYDTVQEVRWLRDWQ